jgi:hypothetical protein
MPPRRRPRDARALRGQRGVQALALGVKSLQHGQAFGQAFDVVCFGDGHLGLVREMSGLKPPTYNWQTPDVGGFSPDRVVGTNPLICVNLRDHRTKITIIAQTKIYSANAPCLLD